MIDPTREELLEQLRRLDPEADEFQVEFAAYYLAAHYHAGQWSNLYRALSASPYKPGASEHPFRDRPQDTCPDCGIDGLQLYHHGAQWIATGGQPDA